MNLLPLNDRILVRVDPPDVQTEEGKLFIPGIAQEAKNSGIVIAVGPGKVNDQGVRIPIGLKVGDHVLFKGYKVDPIKDTEADKIMMTEDAVIALLGETTRPTFAYKWDGTPGILVSDAQIEITDQGPAYFLKPANIKQYIAYTPDGRKAHLPVGAALPAGYTIDNPGNIYTSSGDVWSADAAATRAAEPEKPVTEHKSAGLLEPGNAPIPQNAASMESSLTKYADQFKK